MLLQRCHMMPQAPVKEWQQYIFVSPVMQAVRRPQGLMSIKKKTLTLSGASLEQNIPNPFTNSTVINYTLPQSIVSAQIVITDKGGRTLKTEKISRSGYYLILTVPFPFFYDRI